MMLSVKEWRECRRLTAADMAHACMMETAAYKELEAEPMTASPLQARFIARALQVNISDIDFTCTQGEAVRKYGRSTAEFIALYGKLNNCDKLEVRQAIQELLQQEKYSPQAHIESKRGNVLAVRFR